MKREGIGFAVLLVGLALAVWEAGVRLYGVPVYLLPAPSRVLATLGANAGEYALAAGITAAEAAGGLVLGALAGFALATLMSLWPRGEQGVITLAILVKSTPLVAVAPLLTIWLGFGVLPKVIITALLTFFPVLVNVLAGLSRPDPAWVDVFRCWRASAWETYRHVRLPASLPYFFAALRVSGPLALIGAVVAEWTGASGGLGRAMWLAYTNLNLPHLFAAVFVLAGCGVLIYGGLAALERRVVFWQRADEVAPGT